MREPTCCFQGETIKALLDGAMEVEFFYAAKCPPEEKREGKMLVQETSLTGFQALQKLREVERKNEVA